MNPGDQLFGDNELLLTKKGVQFVKQRCDLVCVCPQCGGRVIFDEELPWVFHSIKCSVGALSFDEIVKLLEVQNA